MLLTPSSRFKGGPRASGLGNSSLEVILWLPTTYLLEEREQLIYSLQVWYGMEEWEQLIYSLQVWYGMEEWDHLIYSLQSLVADVGSTLGLFLGFSLMWGWHLVVTLCTAATAILSAPLFIRMKQK